MRKIAISDIHGFFDQFQTLLHKVEYQPEHDELFLLGDYMDRGPKSKEVLQKVMQLSEHPNVHVIGGNHDSIFLNWVDDDDFRLMPYTHERVGGQETLKSFYPSFVPHENEKEARDYIQHHYQKEIAFLRQLPYYIEDEDHIYVHAGIDPKQEDWKKTSQKNFRWIRQPFYNKPHRHTKTVVFGHTSCHKLHDDEKNFFVWFGDKKIGIDGGVKFGGQLNALLIEPTGYQVVSVPVSP